MEAAWRKLPLTVQIATKLNRSHVVHGKAAYLLPCLGRHRDRPPGRRRAGRVGRGQHRAASTARAAGASRPRPICCRSRRSSPASRRRRSTPIRSVDWDALGGRLRHASATRSRRPIPEIFQDFNARMWTPGGFRKPLAGRASGSGRPRAARPNSSRPKRSPGDPDMRRRRRRSLRLITMRSDGQFNTTIYSIRRPLPRRHGRRMVLFMARADMALRLAQGDLVTAAHRRRRRRRTQRRGLAVVPYDIPEGCIAGYYPECNPLIPLWHHAKESKVPAAKAIDVFARTQRGHGMNARTNPSWRGAGRHAPPACQPLQAATWCEEAQRTGGRRSAGGAGLQRHHAMP